MITASSSSVDVHTVNVHIPVRGQDGSPLVLPGVLTIPADPVGIVLFAHGSGSSRLSPRNVYVASRFHELFLATLLFDLLTPGEAADSLNVFDIDLLADRLQSAVTFISGHQLTVSLSIALLGASTGAAAALLAAARDRRVAAVVSRGGRPDLAGAALRRVRVPTLLLVGERDEDVLTLNRLALKELSCTKSLVLIHGAGHLFEEPGKLDDVAALAGEWMHRHLRGAAP